MFDLCNGNSKMCAVTRELNFYIRCRYWSCNIHLSHSYTTLLALWFSCFLYHNAWYMMNGTYYSVAPDAVFAILSCSLPQNTNTHTDTDTRHVLCDSYHPPCNHRDFSKKKHQFLRACGIFVNVMGSHISAHSCLCDVKYEITRK
jgi:hypothetical protein